MDTWYNVKAGGYNGYLTLTIDGQDIFTFTDATFTAGKAGLFCRGNQSSFWDNVIIECAVNDSLELENITVSNGQNECYQATEVITVGGNGSTFILQDGGIATLVAGQKISMLPGATVLSGGTLHAYISTDGFYCHRPSSSIAIPNEESLSDNPSLPFIENRSLLKVYPNPTPGQFTLDPGETGEQEYFSLEIYNWLGERVIKSNLPSNTIHLLDLSGHADGIYFIQVQQGNKVQTGKIVLNR
jgi:hypothetical protein